MNVSTTNGKIFTLRSETEADQQLLDQLDNVRQAFVIGLRRTANADGGYAIELVEIEADRQGKLALEAQSGRQALSALGQLVSLGLREAAHHRHVSTSRIESSTAADVLRGLLSVYDKDCDIAEVVTGRAALAELEGGSA